MKHKFKIDVINRYFYPVTAGIETVILETFSVMASKDLDITVHTSCNLLDRKDSLKQNDNIRGIKVRRYHLSLFGFVPGIEWFKTNVIILYNFDIFPHSYILLYCLLLRLLGKKKFTLILSPHGGFNPEWSTFPIIQSLIKCVYHFTIGTLLINLVVDRVQAVSEWEKQEMIKKGVNKRLITVISNGLEKEAFENVERKASLKIKNRVRALGKYLIQVGRIHPIKNYETAIRALVYLPENVNFVIAGPAMDQRYKRRLDFMIKKLGLEKRVMFVGVVRGIDKYYLIKKAQMMVHMAFWESFCNVIYEAFSQGKVCITANNTALVLLIQEGRNGFLVKTRDQVNLAKKIKFVLDNKQSKKIKQIEINNRHFISSMSWNRVAEELSNLFAFNKKIYYNIL